jgi:iron complex outermembrane receptor protein
MTITLYTRALLLAGTAGLATFAAPLAAQDCAADVAAEAEAAAAEEDNTIYVTARRREERLIDVPLSVTALSGDDLVKQGVQDLTQIAQQVPNITLEVSRGTNTTLTAFIRGVGQQDPVAGFEAGVGLYVDDVYLNRPQAAVLDIYDVERIEVLRGPAVLLFGGQAVGGAVNALDKRIPRSIPDENIHIDALAGYGSAARDWSGGASIDMPITDRVIVHLDGSYRNSDDLRTGGYILSPNLRAEMLDLAAEEASEGHLEEAAEARELADQRGRIPNSAVKSWTAGGGIAFIDDNGNIGVSYSIYDTNYGIPARPGASHAHAHADEEHSEYEEHAEGEAPVTIGLRQYRLDFRGEVNLGDGLFEKLRLRAGYADYTHTEFEGDEVGTLFNSQGIEARAEFVQNDRNGWRGASGVQYQSRDFEAIGAEAFVPPNITRQFGMFTLQEYTKGNLDTEVALRFDTADLRADTLGLTRSFNNISAAFGLGYHIGDLKIGANISRTGRAPAVEELFSSGPHIATQAYEIGDPDLKSERAWNGELYARYETPGTAFSATLYTNRFDNFIYEAETGDIEDDLPVFQYFQNDAKVWGVEFQAAKRLASFGSSNLSVDGVADYTRAKISSGGGNVPRIPPLRLLGGVLYLGGMVIMLWNTFKTVSMGRSVEVQIPTLAPAH